MNKCKFIKHMAKTGEVSADQFTMFLLEHYLLLGKTLEDYHDDLTCVFEYSDRYATECVKSAKYCIKDFIKRHKSNMETWSDERKRVSDSE